MRFKVPQNVQREDTIVGPLTLKQLVILGLGGGIAYAIQVVMARNGLPLEVWILPVVIIGGITCAFAFLKIHNLPFHLYLMSLIAYHFLPKKRIWIQGSDSPFISSFQRKKESQKKETKKVEKKERSIEELTGILDSAGKKELSEEEKKNGLEKIINQNYQDKQK